MTAYPSHRFLSKIPDYAMLIVNYCGRVESGDEVVISGSTESIPLLREIYRLSLETGAYPTLLVSDPLLGEVFYKYASEEQLSHISPLTKVLFEEYTVHISILSDTHTKSLQSIPPEKVAVVRKARGPLLQKFLEEAAKGEKKWTVAPYPTLAYAQEANMSPNDYEEFVIKAVKLHHANPIAAWMEQAEKQLKLINTLLSKADEIRVVYGKTDLLVKVGGRTWISDDGHENMPGGEVFTGPVEDATEGCVYFNMPQIYMGRIVEGVKLCFHKGKVSDFNAVKGNDFLARMINLDEGSSILGEFAFGLNYDIQVQTKEILFDEKIGGTIHMALGNGYPETGSKNRSSLHWDFILDMRYPEAKVYIDGDLVYESGKFLVWDNL